MMVLKKALATSTLLGIFLVSTASFADDCGGVLDDSGSSTPAAPSCSGYNQGETCSLANGQRVVSQLCDPGSCKLVTCVKGNGSQVTACVDK